MGNFVGENVMMSVSTLWKRFMLVKKEKLIKGSTIIKKIYIIIL